MKLNEFFDSHKTTLLTDVDKLELYQKFLYKKTAKTSPIKRFRFVHAKSFVYLAVIMVLVVGMYGTYFFNNNGSLFQNNLVQADYIAKVLSFEGDFSIEHAGKLSQTKDISNGDTIILSKNAEMIFEIHSGTKSKILGPAKLTIQKVNEDTSKYKLNLIYGDYIQMEGTNIPQNIELAIDDILIRQSDKTQPLNFQLVNEGKGRIIKNNGGNLLVTKNGDIQKTQIKNNQVLAIQKNDITLFQNRGEFSKAMQKGEVSQTFAVNTNTYETIKTKVVDSQSGTQKPEDTTLSFMTLLAPETSTSISTEENTETISQDIATLINQKAVPTKEQSDILRSALSSYFLNNEMATAYTARHNGEEGLANIRSKIKMIYSTFRLSYDSESLSSAIKNLHDILGKKYNINPDYLYNLTILNNRLHQLSSVETSSPTREEFQKPNTLIFK